MELGNHIRQYRKDKGLSQEQFAERILVSRQTVSNWETGRTYPDVQSLLLMSAVLDVTVDELIKGDVEMMREEKDRDVRKMNRLAWLMVLATAAAVAEMILGLLLWEWDTVPTLLCGACLTVFAILPAAEIERLKKKHDILTMAEMSAFEKGLEVDRKAPASLRVRNHPWRTTLLKILAGTAVGALVGFVGAYLIMAVK